MPNIPHLERVADLVETMTVEERIAQLSCVARLPESRWLADGNGTVNTAELLERFPHGLGQIGRPSQHLSPTLAAGATNQIREALADGTRLGIPALFNEEGVHGHMAVEATSYPSAIGLAATWDEKLVEEIFAAVASEVRARGSNYVYAPVLDLARDPRWGRVEETFGEDPFLVAAMGVAAIFGLQGREWSIPADRVLACAKHFAGHGVPESGMNGAPLHAGEREMREEHLVPFAAAVRTANVGAIMAAYHDIDGVPCHTNRWLLTTILRDEWGFAGLVTSDGFGVPQIETVHRVAGDPAAAARLALAAGVDCEVPEPECFSTLAAQVKSGDVPEADINRAVVNVLTAKDRLGLLESDPLVDPAAAASAVDTTQHRLLALEAARQSTVLLFNNDSYLPLDIATARTIAVIGPNAADVHLGGYAEEPAHSVSILDGIRSVAADATVSYAIGCRVSEGVQGHAAWRVDESVLAADEEQDDSIATAVELAGSADVVVLVVGGNESTAKEGWWYDHLGDRDSIDLPGRQEDLVVAVAATGTPIVAVVLGGRPLDLGPLVANCRAILHAWYPGQEGGTAIAEVLFGKTNPSGKLPITFAKSVGQIPMHSSKRASAYRGYLFSQQEPLFPFGFGLSYTTFEYGLPTVEPATIDRGQTTEVRIEVINTGRRQGTEVVQCYLHDRVASVARPLRKLCGFARVELEPGESKTVRFALGPDDLALVDFDMNWTVEPGEFDIYIGSSSVDTKEAVLTVRGPAAATRHGTYLRSW